LTIFLLKGIIIFVYVIGGIDMYIKKIFAAFASAAAVAGCSIAFSANVYATTADDVAAVARSYGYSEEDIQAGYNEYYSHPEDYPSELLDKVILKLHEAGSQIITAGPQVTDVPTTTTASNDPEQPATVDDVITITASDGTTFTRISTEAFIAMSYDEKMAYVRSFSPEQQQAIIDNLTPEEYRSLMKQSPSEQKLQIVGKLSEAAEQMGLNITVDEISDSSLTIAMRNDDGELLNVSTAGASVEDTGYDRRGILACAAALVGIGISALFLVMRKLKADGAEE
jgi:hypothetical protein